MLKSLAKLSTVTVFVWATVLYSTVPTSARFCTEFYTCREEAAWCDQMAGDWNVGECNNQSGCYACPFECVFSENVSWLGWCRLHDLD